MQPLLQELEFQAINPGSCSAYRGWMDTPGKPLLASHAPASGALIAQVALCRDAEYEILLEEAFHASLEWRALPVSARGETLRAIGAAISEQRGALANLLALETGKTWREADAEVAELIEYAELAAGLALYLDESAMGGERVERGYREQWHPMGIIGVITNFDVPMAAWAKRAFPAAVCGNTAIWKPSPKAPLCAVALQRLCERVFAGAGQPRAFSLFQPENVTILSRFVRDSRLPMLAFSGSTFVGRQVAVKIADRLGHSLLEFPGSNAAIVDASADLDAAVRAILAGAVPMAGQRGTALRRVIAHRDIGEQLASALIKGYKKLRIGDPLSPETDMGPLIDGLAVAAFQDALEHVQQEGGDILWGGRVLEQGGNFVEPALARVENHWESVQRESPLPILYLITFETFEEAIALQNAARKPFSSTLFTGDMEHAACYLSDECGDAESASINADFGHPEQVIGRNPHEHSFVELRNTYMRRQVGAIEWSGRPSQARAGESGVSRPAAGSRQTAA